MQEREAFSPLNKKRNPYIVAPINAEKNAAEGRKVRLSIIEESDETKKRESVMTPYPRVSDGI